MIIDSHCHLTYEPMSLALHETVERANRDGVKYMLTISTEDKSFDKILKIVKEHKSVYGTYGIHPHEAKSHQYINSNNIIKILDKFSSNLNDFKKAIEEKNGEKLLKIFASTKNIRKEIIKAGQDVKTPDFGRKKD